MRTKEAEELFAKGLEALKRDHIYLARTCLEQAIEMDNSPEIYSYLALTRAKTQGLFSEAIKMAKEALEHASTNPHMYFNLAKIQLLAGNKEFALRILREGIKYDASGMIRHELELHGNRKPPVFPALKRNSPVNKYLGILLSQLKLR